MDGHEDARLGFQKFNRILAEDENKSDYYSNQSNNDAYPGEEELV